MFLENFLKSELFSLPSVVSGIRENHFGILEY